MFLNKPKNVLAEIIDCGLFYHRQLLSDDHVIYEINLCLFIPTKALRSDELQRVLILASDSGDEKSFQLIRILLDNERLNCL